MIDECLERHVGRLLAAQQVGTQQVLTHIGNLDDDTRAAFSRADERLTVLMRGLDDDAADGPRLFSLEPLGRSLWHPDVTSRRMRLTLWCEHSRLPVHVLEPDRPNAGVYTVDIPQEWWAKAAPLIKATSVVLKTLLPISLAAIELEISENQWEAVKKELTLDKEIVGAVADAGQKVKLPSGNAPAGGIEMSLGTPIRAEGGLMRMLHGTLRTQDITFADLRRVRHPQGDHFLWVHEQYVAEYLSPPPIIPTASSC